MPIFDGSDCQTLETFVNVITVVTIVITGLITLSGFRQGALIGPMFCLVFGFVISPFMLYFLAFSWGLTILCMVLFAAFSLVVYSIQSCTNRQEIGVKHTKLESNNIILSDVKIENQHLHTTKPQ